MAFVLINLADPDEKFILDGDSITIGRSPDCHIVIDDAKLAPVHCWLKRDGQSYRLVDAGSSAGVRVNSQPITTAELRLGDWIGLGRATYRLDTTDAAALPQPPPTAASTAAPTAAPAATETTPTAPAATAAPRERTASGGASQH